MEKLQIEDAFLNICEEKSEYLEYYHIYFATKYILQKDYYPYIKDVTSFYTDHSVNHINRILDTLFDVLKPHLIMNEDVTPRKYISQDKASNKLNAYELYLLMCSVLWHDIGNLFGRINHERNINKLFDKAKDFLYDTSSSEWIKKICNAHSGVNAIESIIDRERKNEKKFTFYPRFLAALLRLSDELDEDKQRIGEKIIGLDIIPKKKLAYWFFCKCNDSIKIEEEDYGRRKIVIESKMDKNDIFKSMKKETENGIDDVIGIEEYSKRINKINEERRYCSKYFKPHYFKIIDKINLLLRIYDNNNFLEEINFTYDDNNGVDEFFNHSKDILIKFK
ncbi:MAG: hypothetical protein ISS16_04665 [Ignavibacteria bacterium]|nr:hypothetical protein [Ignavibacteria bacterium]